jgi:membrane protein implicated in regulation of membrane protease activity
MLLRDRRTFRVIGYTLMGLGIAGAVLHIVQMIASGHWLGGYYSARLIPWNYGSAFIALVCLALAALVALVVRFVQRRRSYPCATDSTIPHADQKPRVDHK